LNSNIQIDNPAVKSDSLFCHICLTDINKPEEYNEYDRLTLCPVCYKKVNLWEKIDFYSKEDQN